MEFYWKFYESIGFKVLFGLLLSLSVSSGPDCKYFQNLKDRTTYYIYNPEYPNNYTGEKDCSWKMTSSSNSTVNITCALEMDHDCHQNQMVFKDNNNNNTVGHCGQENVTKVIKPNITRHGSVSGVKDISNDIYMIEIQLISLNATGRFLCEIKTINTNYNTNCDCGRKKVTRIVGGNETGVNEYPMMCGLVDAVQKMIYCGCTIISEQYVITAAHCVDNKNISILAVIVGEHDVRTGKETNATKLFRLSGYTIHFKYRSDKNAHYDIAVCKIYGTITFSAEVGPVCLPFLKNIIDLINTVIALGWGLLEFAGAKASTLQKVGLKVISNEECEIYYGDVSTNNICTYTPGKDACQMDSGGPLLWQNPKTHRIILVGIISAGLGCAADEPAVSMSVEPFIYWIIKVTPGAHYCTVE